MPHPRGSPVVKASRVPVNFLQRQPGAVRPKRLPRRAVDHAARRAPADRRVVRTVANAVGATTHFQELNFWRLSNPRSNASAENEDELTRVQRLSISETELRLVQRDMIRVLGLPPAAEPTPPERPSFKRKSGPTSGGRRHFFYNALGSRLRRPHRRYYGD